MEITVSVNDRFVNRTVVAQVLTSAIKNSDKSQKQIANEVGLDDCPNMITMLKQGERRLPVERAIRFAEVLGIDKAEFVMLVIKEEYEEVFDAINECYELKKRT